MATLDATLPQNESLNAKVSNGYPSKSVPWVEKYRPQSVNEISAHEEIISFFQNATQTGNLPNLLFYGPPGTGKTSSILALARDMFGSENMRHRVLELNASDERGIQVIREKVKSFAQLSVSGTINNKTQQSLPPFKLIILDEADNMTNAAQAALRRMMESTLGVTRFCLICNYITKIIEPIISRCSCFYFKPLPSEQCLSRLVYIKENESLSISNENLEFLVKYSNGDLRKAIMYLQRCRYLFKKEISSEDLIEICGIIPKETVDSLFVAINRKDFHTLTLLCNSIKNEGYSVSKFIDQLVDIILVKPDTDDEKKAKILVLISLADRNLSEGANEYLQLLSLMTHIFEIVNSDR